MSFLNKFRRLSAVALIAAVPFVAACADDDGAQPVGQDPGTTTGTITGTVSGPSGPIVGALVGTSPATATALSDANGAFTINNVPIPTNPTAYAVTASASGFTSASASVSLSSTNPTGNVTLTLAAQTGPPVPTTGDLNVLVTNRNGTPQSGADVTVSDGTGAVVAMATTDANGFALFSGLNEGAFTVSATATLSGIDFRASGGTNIRGGETSFLQLTLTRDFGQSVFPNVDGESVTLDDSADIRFVPVPGGTDNDPSVDCNVIRTQHMFIAEVVLGDADETPVSGVKVQWDLNISSQFAPGPANNTGSIVDSDDPDLDPGTARSSLDPSFIVDTRTAVTFTNDNDQTISFNNTNVVIGAGQTWIIITSPVEGITDVIAATSDIPATDPDCANSDPDACDKEIAIKRWVNWDTAVAELQWDGNGGDPNDAVNPAATFDFVDDGDTLTNVLDRAEPDTLGGIGCTVDQVAGIAGTQCELSDNRFLIYAEVSPLRLDSPFTAFHNGTIKLEITDDVPDIEIFDDLVVDLVNTIPNVEQGPPPSPSAGTDIGTDDDFTITDDNFEGEFDFGNETAPGVFSDPDSTGWVIIEMRLDPSEFFCDDVNGDTACDPGNGASPDTFSTAYQRLLEGTADNKNSFSVTFCDEFGEDCDRIDFMKEWVASRVQIIKNFPGATIREVDDKNVSTHTVQVSQQFSYTITVINDGEVQSPNVRITDTLPRFGVQFEMPDDGIGVRDGSQAFAYVTDRPTFDPVAVVYAIDDDNDEDGDVINTCIRGDNGTTVGNAYVVPASCTAVVVVDAGTIAAARTAAESASADGDQVVWIQWFDDSILGRQQPGGGIETEDTVEVTLIADEDLVDIDQADPNINGYGDSLPGIWCNIATATDGPGNLDDSPLTTQSLAADTLCHEVVEALLEVRKTTQDAVVSAGAQAVFDVEIKNAGSAALTSTMIVDTLDQALFDATPNFDETNITLDDDFSDATVTVNGRIFTVDIGTLDPTSSADDDFVLVYTVAVNTPGQDGVFCNRVTASGVTPGGTISDQDIACVTTTVTIELDVSNEDGFVDDAGVFQSTKETFTVGEGSASDDLSFVYRVDVINQSPFSATGVVVVDEVAPNTAAIACREVLAAAPAGEGGGANPSVGSVGGGDCTSGGFTWTIGTLTTGVQATIFFRAEALAPQNGVGNRVRLTSDQLTGEIVDEEPTTVTSN